MLEVVVDESELGQREFLAAEQAALRKSRGRSARFRLDVVAAFGYTYALTGHHLTTVTTGSLVDAAHIRQFARAESDEVTNGMALSKNAHWSFDAGFRTLSDNHRPKLTQITRRDAIAEYHFLSSR